MRVKRVLAFLISAVMAVQCAPMYAAEDEVIFDDQIIELDPEVTEDEFIPEEEIIFEEEIPAEEDAILVETELETVEEEAPVLYADAVVSGDFSYTVNSDGATATITDYTGTDSVLEVPEKIDGYTVTVIGGSAFSGCASLTEIAIPDTVTGIGEYAFEDCTALTEIDIPDSVTTISRSAFRNCKGLSEITIPDSVTSIGNNAFRGCTGLTSFEIPDSVINMGQGIFRECTGITSIVIPSTLKSYGDDSYWSTNGYNGYNNSAFEGSNITTIVIEEGATTIPENAFADCVQLTDITIPDSVTSIGAAAFMNCEGLDEIDLPDNLTTIGGYAFAQCLFTGIAIPDTVTGIGEYAFEDCGELTEIDIPDSVTTISRSAFRNCKGLSEITIPDSVISIGNNAFRGCTGLTSFEIPESVVEMGQGVFRECTGITSIVIPSTLKSYGDDSYWSTNGYNGYNNSAFEGSSITTIIIEEGTTVIPENAFADCVQLTDITIPDSVTSIGAAAFMNCEGLDEIDLPDNLTTIGGYAFAQCLFTGIAIPDTVTSIGEYAFEDCNDIENVYFGGNVPTTWGNNIFLNNADNFTIYYPEGNTSGWTSPTWTAPDGTVYNTATFVPETAIIKHEFNGNQYAVIDESMTWTEAKVYCENLGGHLVTITSAEEQKFVESIMEEDSVYEAYWLGGYKDTSWTWITDEEFVYTNWAPNEPNHKDAKYLQIYSTANGNDVFKWDNTWEDGDHAGGGIQEEGLICEWEVVQTVPITTTWDTSVLTLAAGDTYAFSGRIISLEPLDKLHISVVRADNTSVGIDYYRETEIGGTTFDLSAVPSITAGSLLKGLQVTNNQEELSLSNGSYLIRMWITDTSGNYLDGLSKMITITDVSAAPVVEMLPVTEITASTAKLQAKIVDAKGGIIVDFGFNMYDTETGGERHAQYRAKQTNPEYQTDPYYQTAEYEPETGIFTVVLQDHNPNRTYYAEGFAVYYQGDTPVTGFTPERTGFTTAVAEVNITSPKAYEVLSSAEISVTGSIDCKVDGITFADPILTVYDYQMAEVASVNGILNDDNTFSAEIDLTDRYAGTYSITVSADASNGSSVVSAPVSFNIPGKLAVYTDPVDESNITATQATVTGRVPDTMGETLEYYGFRIYDETGEYLGMYFVGHDDETHWTTKFNPSTGVITGDIPAEPDTTIYYEAFASYITGGVQIDSIAATRESFTTKCVDITLDKINSYDGLSYMLDETAAAIKFHGHISNIAAGHTFENPQLVVTNSKGEVVDTAEAILEGNKFTAEFDMSAYEVGVYTITAQITDDTGRVSYSNIKKVEMPKKCTEIVFKNNLTGEELVQTEVHTIAHWNWLVVDIEIDTNRSNINKIEWVTSNNEGLKLVPWNESDKSFDKARSQTCQFNASKIGTYTVTVNVYNHDGTVISATLFIEVHAVATLCFVDYSTLMPLTGTKVNVESTGGKAYSISAVTDENGQIILMDIPQYATYTVEAKKSGYTTLSKKYVLGDSSNQTIVMYDDDLHIYDVKMTAFYTQGGKTVTTHAGTDILNSSSSIDIAKDYTVSFNVTANEALQITKYQLLQNNKVMAEDSDGTFMIYDIEKFSKNIPIYLRLCHGKNQHYDVALQLKLEKSLLNEIADGIGNTELSIGNEIKIQIPADVPIVGGHEFSLNLLKWPASFRKSGNQVYIAIGGNNIFKAKNDDDDITINDEKPGFEWEWRTFCDLVADAKKNGIKEAMKLVEDYSWEVESTKKPFYSGMDVEFSVLGTFMFNLDTAESNMTLVIEAKVKNSKDYTAPPLGPVPMVITLSFEGSIGAKFYGNETGHSIDEVLISLLENVVVETGIKIQAGYGAGLSYVGHVTINGGIALDADIYLTSIGKVEMEFGFDLSLRAKLLAWEYQKSLAGVTYRLNNDGWAYKWKNQSDWTPLSSSISTYSLRTINDFVNIPTTEYSLADRSYLDYTSDWYEYNDIATFASFGNSDYTTDIDTLMTYIYPDTQLQTVQTEDHKVMIWLTDDATRSSANRTKLVYSVYNELTGKWTTPQSVADDGTLDSYPYLTTDGISIWAAWVNMNTALSDDMNLDTGMLHSEICAAMFDPQTMSFRQVTALTADDVIDLNPKIAVSGDQIAAAWVSNDSGDLWGTSGTNTICISIYENGSWSEAQAVKVLNSAVSNMEIGFVDGNLSVAYCLDTDNSFDTVDDIAVYVIVPGTAEEYLLAENGLNSSIQFVTIENEQYLTWYSDGYVRCISTFGGESQDLLNGVPVIGGYQIVSDINGTVILKTVPMDGYSELYVSVYDEDDDSWSNDIRLTYQNNAYINDFGALVEENGDITVIYTSEIDDMAQMCSGTIGFVKDISLDSVSHNSSDAVPGQMTKLYADITNHGIADVESVLFHLKQGDTVLCETNVPLELKAGETVSVEVPVTVPESVGITEYEVEAVLTDAEEIDLFNNIGSVEFGHGNLSLYVSDMYGENSRLLTVEVINNGGYETRPQIVIYKDNEEKTVIETLDLEPLAGKRSSVVNYSLTDLEDSVYIEVISDRSEFYTGDNLVYYSLESAEVLYGDLNDDGTVSAKDAQYLAYHLTSPEEYPVDTDDIDFNGDGEATQADALYLLRHTILPERYPLILSAE